jgi:hypothetical protein
MAGWAAKSGPAGPPNEGGPHPRGRNAMEDLSAAQVAARRGGPRGERPPSPPGRRPTNSASAQQRAVRMPERKLRPALGDRHRPRRPRPDQGLGGAKRNRARSRQRRETPIHFGINHPRTDSSQALPERNLRNFEGGRKFSLRSWGNGDIIRWQSYQNSRFPNGTMASGR